jgi:hypothetical protein
VHKLPKRALYIGLALTLFCASWSWAEPLKLAHGWSVDASGGQVAAAEAIAKMEKGIDAPRFIVLYTTADYGERETVATLRQRYPEAKIFGMNVYRGVFTSDGLHIGERGSLAMMGFAGGDLAFGVAARTVKDSADITAVTRETFAAAARDAGATPEDQPSMVLLGALKGKEDIVVAELGNLVPRDVPLIGGTHCNNNFQQGYVIGNDEIIESGIVIGLIYSQVDIGVSFYSGFVGKKKSGIITGSEGRILKEIDSRPAQEVYREWAEGHFDDIDSSVENVLVMKSATCPLAKAIRLPNGKLRYIPVRPQRFNTDGSLSMGGDVSLGDTIYYVEGNKEALRRRAAAVAREAMINGKIKVKDVAGGLHIYCAGAAKTLGLEVDGEVMRMVGEVRKVVRDSPFIGGFTAAEQGTIPGYGIFNGNLMSSMVVFRK